MTHNVCACVCVYACPLYYASDVCVYCAVYMHGCYCIHVTYSTIAMYEIYCVYKKYCVCVCSIIICSAKEKYQSARREICQARSFEFENSVTYYSLQYS